MSIIEQVEATEWRGVIDEGRRRGSLTLDEVLSVLGVELTIDVLTEVEAALQPEGIRLDVEVHPDHTSDHTPDHRDRSVEPAEEVTVGGRSSGVIERPHRPSRAKQRTRSKSSSGESGGSGDSVRLYLSEIGQVSLI
ncbi:MAG: RNA polymerase sigma factor RpoD, partial [Candidatus Neomicrothrix subdominans]